MVGVVNTVGCMQGSSYPVVILTLASKDPGFFGTNRRRQWVALSRASKTMILIGDVDTYSQNGNTAHLIAVMRALSSGVQPPLTQGQHGPTDTPTCTRKAPRNAFGA